MKRRCFDVCLIFILLTSIYGISYSGTFVTDDEHILASRALSIAFDDEANDFRAFGNEKIRTYLSTTEPYSSFGLNIEPMFGYLSAQLMRVSLLTGVGRIQAAFLLNILVTALTGCFVYWIVRALGYSRSAALIAALGYGLGTLAWPYSKTNLRDPLAALFLCISWGMVATIHPPIKLGQAWIRATGVRIVISFFAFLFGVLTKNTVLVAAPTLVWMLASRIKVSRSWDWLKEEFNYRPAHKGALGLFALAVLCIAGYLLAGRHRELARSSLDYYQSLLTRIAADNHSSLPQAIAGPLLSSGKSIFLYSPILVLAFGSLRRNKDISLPAWSYLGLLVLAQALFYGELWWGGANWGLRFILPAIPLLMVAAAPQIDILLENSRSRLALVSLGVLSLVPQVVGVATSQFQFFNQLFSSGVEGQINKMLWQVSESPIVVQLQLLLHGETTSSPVSRIGAGLPIILILLPLLLLIAAVLLVTRKQSKSIYLLAAVMPLLLVGLVRSYAPDPYYYQGRQDFANANRLIERNSQSNDFVLVSSYTSPIWYYWMNWGSESASWAALPSELSSAGVEVADDIEDGASQLDAATEALIQEIANSHDFVWLVVPGDGDLVSLRPEYLKLQEYAAAIRSWTTTSGEHGVYVIRFRMTND